jgi:hypothetical protein
LFIVGPPEKNDLKRRGDRVAARTPPDSATLPQRGIPEQWKCGETTVAKGELLQFRYRFPHVATNLLI